MDSISSPPEKDLLMITQDGCSIESYVEEFIQLAHQGDWNDDSLKIVFWSGLSNHLFLQAPPAATPGSLAQYIDHVLILAGSSFTLEEVPASQPVPPPAAKSVYPRARKWASNSADLRTKVLDPSLTSDGNDGSAYRGEDRAATPRLLPSPQDPFLASALQCLPPRKCPPVPAPRKCPPVPTPRQSSSESPLVPSSSSESPLIPSRALLFNNKLLLLFTYLRV